MKKISIVVLTLLAFIGLSACSIGEERDKPVIMTSLFPQYDITTQLVGNHADVAFLLPPGVEPHSYEPTPRKVLEILNADLLIYTGDAMEPWVSRLIQVDSETTLSLLDISKNIQLISDTHDHSGHEQHDNHDDHDEDNHDDDDHHDDDHDITSIDTFEILSESSKQRYSYVHGTHWDGTLPTIGQGATYEFTAHIISSDERLRELNSTELGDHLKVRLYEGAPTGIVELENHRDHVGIKGLQPGITQVVFSWVHDGDIRYTTPPINIQITEEDNHDEYTSYDPHIWLDPINAIQIVEDIKNALIELMPEHESAFIENANTYISALQTVHNAYLDLVEHSELNTIMHGGHNAFGYLAHRYNLNYVNPYRGFSADAEPTPQRLGDMIDLMTTQNIEHLFSEVLIDPKVADAITSDTGADILYLYAGGNIPHDQLESGFSLIDLFNHNLEQFKIGLKYNGQ